MSVNTEPWVLNTDLVATEGQHRCKKVQFMSDSDTARRFRLLTPDTRNLKTAGKGYRPTSPLRGGPKPGPLDPDLYAKLNLFLKWGIIHRVNNLMSLTCQEKYGDQSHLANMPNQERKSAVGFTSKNKIASAANR